MPNWCYNSATLHHDSKEVIDGLEAELQKDNAEPFNYLRPNPAGEWQYDWSVENWGTKWDVSIMDWEREDDNTIVLHFDSAWSPPIMLYEFLETEGWTVRAMYHEPGMGFAGRFEDGFDEYFEMDWTDRASIESLPEDILDFTNALEDLERYEEEQEEERLAELERTEWFPKKIKPVHIGKYEVKSKAWPYAQYCNWDGEKWSRWDGDDIKVEEWRGCTENHDDWDAEKALNKIFEDYKV